MTAHPMAEYEDSYDEDGELLARVGDRLPRRAQRGGASAGETSVEASELEGWDDPLALPGTGAAMPFPVDVLGTPAAAFVRAVAAETGTPADLTAVAVLGVCSTLIAGAVVVEADAGWRSPTNLYLQAFVASGEGKTPVVKRVREVLDDIERDRRERMLPKVTESEARKRIAEARRKDAENRAAKATGPERLEAEQEALDAAHDAASVVVPALPRSYTHEATPEGLIKLLAEQDGRLGLVTSEGAEFFEMSSRYQASGRSNLGIYLHGFDGDRHVSDRAGRDPIVIERTTLTVCLFTQTPVLGSLGKDREAANRGLYGRFLWSLPQSRVGWRSVESCPVPPDVDRAWTDHMTSLANEAYRTELPPLRLDSDATKMFLDWRASHEVRLRPGSGDLSGMVEWASKLPGQVLRLAGNLHALRIGTLYGVVIDETMAAALELTDYFIDHARNAFGLMGADDAARDAAAVLRWLQDRRDDAVSLRDVYTSKDWDPDRTRAAMTVLDRYGWVRAAPREPRSGRPSEKFSIHPKVRYRTAQNPLDPAQEQPKVGVLSRFAPEIPGVADLDCLPAAPETAAVVRVERPNPVPTGQLYPCPSCGERTDTFYVYGDDAICGPCWDSRQAVVV